MCEYINGTIIQENFTTKKIIYDENNGLWYELRGDYYFPCLAVPAQEERPKLKEKRTSGEANYCLSALSSLVAIPFFQVIYNIRTERCRIIAKGVRSTHTLHRYCSSKSASLVS